MIDKILPFLSRYLPAGLAVKGISKVNPKLGSFISNAATAGYTADSILDFIRDRVEPQGIKSERNRLQQGASQGTLRPDEMSNLQKLNDQGFNKGIPSAIGIGAGALNALGNNSQLDQMQPQQSSPEVQQPQQAQQAPDQRNIIAQYSDELEAFLNNLIQQGRNPLEAGALAQLHPRFQKIISRMEQDHKAPFSSILTSIYGQGQQQQAQPQQSHPQQTQAPQPQQPGQGQQALMAILQQIQQQRGR